MDTEGSDPTHRARSVVIDGQEHKVFQHLIRVAELFDLAEKSPEEWDVESELQGGDRVTLSSDDEIHLREGHPAVFHMRRRERHHEHHGGCELTVVVNSEPISIEVPRSIVLSALVAEVLGKAKTAGRAEDQWELKTEAGAVLNLALNLEEAGVECGSTLFLSLKAGAAGDAAGELLVDPLVTRMKFGDEVSAFHRIERSYSKRGIWLVRADYPEVFIVFGAPNAKPLRLLAFGALIDFTNYDLWAPSVKIVDPITQVPYKGEELPPQALLLRRQPSGSPTPAGAPAPGNDLGRYMVWHLAGDVPFLCHPGVREYHDHPAHTGDSWLLHRGTGEGRLSRIVEILFQYGSSKLIGLQAQLIPAVSVPEP